MPSSGVGDADEGSAGGAIACGEEVEASKALVLTVASAFLRGVLKVCDPEKAIGALWVALCEVSTAEGGAACVQLLERALTVLLLYDVRSATAGAHPTFTTAQLVQLKGQLVVAQVLASTPSGDAPAFPRAYLHAAGLLASPRWRALEARAAAAAAAAAQAERSSLAKPPSRRGAKGKGAPKPPGRTRGLARLQRLQAQQLRAAVRAAARLPAEGRPFRARLLGAGPLLARSLLLQKGAQPATLSSLWARRALLLARCEARVEADLPAPPALAPLAMAPPPKIARRLAAGLHTLHGRWDTAAQLRRLCNGAVLAHHAGMAAAEAARVERAREDRVAALKANDYRAYCLLLKRDATSRISTLMRRTDSYLAQMARKLELLRKAGAGEGDADVEAPPPAALRATLRPYQAAGLRWMLALYRNGLNGILADEMGLGKTVQVIALLCHLVQHERTKGPFLIVIPSSVLPNWSSELARWAPSLEAVVYAGPEPQRAELFAQRIARGRFQVCLTTFEMMMSAKDRPRLAKVKWAYLVMDEAHRIKNAQCKLNEQLQLYSFAHRLLLTGTPVQNNLGELFTLMQFLMPTVFDGDAQAFSRMFETPFDSDAPEGGAQLDEEERLLLTTRMHEALRPFMLRRLKEKVATDLPAKKEVLIRCHMGAYQRMLYDMVLGRVLAGADGDGCAKGRVVSVNNQLMELRTICNHPFLSRLHSACDEELCGAHPASSLLRHCGKLEVLDRLLGKLRAGGHRVLLFCTMTRVLDVLEEYLTWRGHSFTRLDGATAAHTRGQLVRDFQAPGCETFVFLLSVRAGGFGLNLQGADTVVMFDSDWNPQVDTQAQARSHRIGQTRECLVIRLEVQGSIEEAVRAASQRKLGVSNRAVEGGCFDGDATSEKDRASFLHKLLRDGAATPDSGDASPCESTLDDARLNALISRDDADAQLFAADDARRAGVDARFWARLQALPGAVAGPMPARLADAEQAAPMLARVAQRSAAAAASACQTETLGRGARKHVQKAGYVELDEAAFLELCENGVDSGAAGAAMLMPLPPAPRRHAPARSCDSDARAPEPDVGAAGRRRGPHIGPPAGERAARSLRSSMPTPSPPAASSSIEAASADEEAEVEAVAEQALVGAFDSWREHVQQGCEPGQRTLTYFLCSSSLGGAEAVALVGHGCWRKKHIVYEATVTGASLAPDCLDLLAGRPTRARVFQFLDACVAASCAGAAADLPTGALMDPPADEAAAEGSKEEEDGEDAAVLEETAEAQEGPEGAVVEVAGEAGKVDKAEDAAVPSGWRVRVASNLLFDDMRESVQTSPDGGGSASFHLRCTRLAALGLPAEVLALTGVRSGRMWRYEATETAAALAPGWLDLLEGRPTRAAVDQFLAACLDACVGAAAAQQPAQPAGDAPAAPHACEEEAHAIGGDAAVAAEAPPGEPVSQFDGWRCEEGLGGRELRFLLCSSGDGTEALAVVGAQHSGYGMRYQATSLAEALATDCLCLLAGRSVKRAHVEEFLQVCVAASCSLAQAQRTAHQTPEAPPAAAAAEKDVAAVAAVTEEGAPPTTTQGVTALHLRVRDVAKRFPGSATQMERMRSIGAQLQLTHAQPPQDEAPMPPRKRRAAAAPAPDILDADAPEEEAEAEAEAQPGLAVGGECVECQLCHHCGSSAPPQRVAGPVGRKLVCSACGVRYESVRSLQPVGTSPSSWVPPHHQAPRHPALPPALLAPAPRRPTAVAATDADAKGESAVSPALAYDCWRVDESGGVGARTRRGVLRYGASGAEALAFLGVERAGRSFTYQPSALGATLAPHVLPVRATKAALHAWLTACVLPDAALRAGEGEEPEGGPRGEGTRQAPPAPAEQPLGAASCYSQPPCDNCGAAESPYWRKGPPCKPRLCNACGARYLRTRTLEGSASAAQNQDAQLRAPAHAQRPQDEEAPMPPRKRRAVVAVPDAVAVTGGADERHAYDEWHVSEEPSPAEGGREVRFTLRCRATGRQALAVRGRQLALPQRHFTYQATALAQSLASAALHLLTKQPTRARASAFMDACILAPSHAAQDEKAAEEEDDDEEEEEEEEEEEPPRRKSCRAAVLEEVGRAATVIDLARLQSPEGISACPGCGKEMRRSQLAIHMRKKDCQSFSKQLPSIPFPAPVLGRVKCPSCEHVSPNLKALRKHYASLHGEKKSCAKCSKQYGRSDALRKHERTCHAAGVGEQGEQRGAKRKRDEDGEEEWEK